MSPDRTIAPPAPVQTGADVPAKDSRTATRRPAADVPSIEGIRLSPYRAEAVLINISESGILAECGMRLPPGTEVTVVFAGSGAPAAVKGRVARTVIARMGPEGIRYHVGIAFTHAIALPEAPAAVAAAAVSPHDEPAPLDAPSPAVEAPVPATDREMAAPEVQPTRFVNQW